MALVRAARPFLGCSVSCGRLLSGLIARRRLLATASNHLDQSKLPLAGVRVLDMTRVLAGVCPQSKAVKSVTGVMP